jgi:hypothetical protein
MTIRWCHVIGSIRFSGLGAASIGFPRRIIPMRLLAALTTAGYAIETPGELARSDCHWR